jgi:hypothetical protein
MSNSKATRRQKNTERGEAELLLFGVVVLITCLISGSIWLLGWIKNTKDGRIIAQREARLARLRQGPFVPRADPAEYFVRCNGSVMKILQTDYPCSVLPESYGELFVFEDEY